MPIVADVREAYFAECDDPATPRLPEETPTPLTHEESVAILQELRALLPKQKAPPIAAPARRPLTKKEFKARLAVLEKQKRLLLREQGEKTK